MKRVRSIEHAMPFVMLLLVGAGCDRTTRDQSPAFWPEGIARVWVGPDCFANRLADWRIDDGRLECVEADRRFPLRTLFLLTRSLRPGHDPFSMRVTTGPVEADRPPAADSFTGFLIGGGGEHVDYRLTAWTHHKPAEDGGLLAVIDGSGAVAFRSNSTDLQTGNQWAVSGGVDEETIPLLAGGPGGSSVIEGGLRGAVVLELTGEAVDGGYEMHLTARDEASGAVISEARYTDVAGEYLDGGIALVSHLGPQGSPAGYWFEEWEVSGRKVERRDEHRFGPVLTTQYTLSRGVLHLTAQMPPLGSDDTGSVALEIRKEGRGGWRVADETEWLADSYIAPFRVDGWNATRDTPFRVRYELKTGPDAETTCTYEGVIRAEPDEGEFVVAAFTGHKNYTGGLRWNSQGYWFPHRDVIDAVSWHDPDFLFFSGDQVYEGDLTPAIKDPIEKAILDYLYKWYRWCWGFRDLTRDRPAVTIPDDHDVYHGNVWGAGGKKAEAYDGVTAQDSGGYVMPPRFVNMVHQTQTSHLPDPYDPTPVEQGISVYYTDVRYGGVSFAVIADRQWKSSPTVTVPDGRFVNGWSQAPGFDPVTGADVPEAVLLGERQLRFLGEWAADWSNATWMKVVLSQTIFANVATIPADASSGAVLPTVPIYDRDVYPDNWKKASDGDSNGWPQSGRNRAIREMRRGFAIHIAGDQHLGSTIRYGVDEWGDAGYALCVPSVGNTWPRRWFPPEPGSNREPGSPAYTGDFFDGFGNRMTVFAVSNPFLTGIEPTNLHDRAPGYGIVRMNRETRDIIIECWPRWVDPSAPGAEQYRGWPVACHQLDNYSREPAGFLPRIAVEGMEDPVIQVIREDTDEIVYTIRIAGQTFQPRVFSLETTYTLLAGDPDSDRMERNTGLRATGERADAGGLIISFREGAGG
jgi:hypothetical protein